MRKLYFACLITLWPNSGDTKWCCLVWTLFCLLNFYNHTEFLYLHFSSKHCAQWCKQIHRYYRYVPSSYNIQILLAFPWLGVKTAASGTAHASGAGKAKSPAFKTNSGAPYRVSSVDKWTSRGIWRVSTSWASSVNPYLLKERKQKGNAKRLQGHEYSSYFQGCVWGAWARYAPCHQCHPGWARGHRKSMCFLTNWYMLTLFFIHGCFFLF